MKWFVSSDIHGFYDEWVEALKAKEKVAKAEVNAYKAKIQQEHKENMANLKVKLAEATNKEEVQAETETRKEEEIESKRGRRKQRGGCA